jgi:competence protein ComEC
MRRVGLCILVAALGGLRYQSALPDTTPQSIWLHTGTATVQGVVIEEPRRGENGQRVVLAAEAIHAAAAVQPATGRLLVLLPTYPTYTYGQRLLVTGQLAPPPAAARPNAFDYRAYLERQGIFVLVRDPLEVQVVADDAGNPLLGALLAFRRTCHALILRHIPEPQASVAGGMLLGLKADIPAPVYQSFAITGTAHLLVISGWHLSLIAVLAAGAAARLRLQPGAVFGLTLAVVWLYALFVGAGPSVLRAAVMASLVALAAATARQPEAWRGLAVACVVLTLADPQLLWDVGFQLSVLATASLLAFGQPVTAYLERWPPLRQPALRPATAALAATLAVQVLILPLIMYYFGNLSLVAPLANMLLVPAMPFAMLGGLLALAINLLTALLAGVPLLGDAAALLTAGVWLVVWLPFVWLTETADLLAAQSWANVRVPGLPLWALLTYYGAVGAAWLVWQRHRRNQPASAPVHSTAERIIQ